MKLLFVLVLETVFHSLKKKKKKKTNKQKTKTKSKGFVILIHPRGQKKKEKEKRNAMSIIFSQQILNDRFLLIIIVEAKK